MSLKESFAWLWRSTYGSRLAIFLSSLYGVAQVGFSLLFVLMSKRLVDIATARGEGDLWLNITFFALSIVGQLVCAAAINRTESLSLVKMKNSVRSRLFSRVMISRWSGRESFHSGDLANRLEEDVRLVSEAMCSYLPAFIISGVQLVSAFCFLMLLQAQLAWALLFVMPFAIIVSKLFMTRLRKLTAAIRSTDSLVQAHLQENIQNNLHIRALEQSSRAIDGLDSLQDDLRGKEERRINFTTFSKTILSTGFMAGYALTFLWGIFGLRDGLITFGMMTAFLQLVGQVQRPVVDLSRYLPTFINALASVDRLSQIDSMPIEEQGESVTLGDGVGVRFEDVSFSYPDDDRMIFDHFNCDFKPSVMTAIVGETGAGKSTSIRLMLALLRADSGRVVLYNGRGESSDVSPLTRCNLVYVPQGNTLMSGTIRQNLLFGKADATDEELRAVLEMAVAEFVYDLPEGLDSVCGERGSGLSEGQAQRIAIARGLLRPGSVMLLDEPTSSLDAATESLLLERLQAGAQSKTIIIITHRESAIQMCSEVIKIG